MEIHDLIKGSLEKLEQGFVPRKQAVDARGMTVEPTSPHAVKFCIYGAMVATLGDTPWKERRDTIDAGLEAIAATMTYEELQSLTKFSPDQLNVVVSNHSSPDRWSAVNKSVGFNNVMGQDKTCDLLRRTLDHLPVPVLA